jgi:predicted MFS family arabinose efflux permease
MAIWFVRRRSTALAIITFAAGLASTIFIPVSDMLLGNFGWRQSVLILGIFLAITTIPLHAFVLRRRPHDLGLLPDGVSNAVDMPATTFSLSLSDAVHNRFFWLLTCAFSLAAVASTAISVHFIPLLISSGISASNAAVASGTIGVMKVAGRFFFAPMDNRFSGRTMVVLVFALQAVAMFVLLGGHSLLVIGIYVIIFGMSDGAKTLARASIVVELFGSSHYGRISSIMAFFLMLAGTVAPVGAGLIYDYFGSYEPMLWIVVALAIAATSLVAFSKSETLRTVEQMAIYPSQSSAD